MRPRGKGYVDNLRANEEEEESSDENDCEGDPTAPAVPGAVASVGPTVVASVADCHGE